MIQKHFTILVLEENEWYNRFLVHTLNLNPDYSVKAFHSAKDLLKHTGDAPDIVVMDYHLSDLKVEEVMASVKSMRSSAEVIIISEQNTIEKAIELIKLGAHDYLIKDDRIKDKLLDAVGRIYRKTCITDVIQPEIESEKKSDVLNSIIGSSPAILNVIRLIEKAVSTSITVVITGETGTGKEIVAKAIHHNSSRKNKPFVAVNVSAIPSDLIENELFGHEKGSFTGAEAKRIGKFEQANGGTLFLDEIGEMDISFQAKLLRVLQEKEITRIGSNVPVKVDCRILAATHRNLQAELRKGKFREDLYYRFFGLTIELPPLRERGKDVIILAGYFMGLFCRDNNMKLKTLSDEAQNKLLKYPFPGNVRELKSIIELAAVMSAGPEIQANEISLPSHDVLADVLKEELTMKEYELRILKDYLKRYDNIKLVAEKLDIGQSTIYRMLKELEAS